jgi:hypothetical protein
MVRNGIGQFARGYKFDLQARKGNSGVTFRVPRKMRIVAILGYETDFDNHDDRAKDHVFAVSRHQAPSALHPGVGRIAPDDAGGEASTKANSNTDAEANTYSGTTALNRLLFRRSLQCPEQLLGGRERQPSEQR